MAQDIRDLLRADKDALSEPMIQDGHEVRFLSRLDEAFIETPKKSTMSWIRVAASVVVIIATAMIGYTTFNSNSVSTTENQVVDVNTTKNATIEFTNNVSPLAKVSPEYEKAENYLLTSIKFELSQIDIDNSNKELVEGFMMRLEDLDKEYKRLSTELIQVGANMQSVEAMIGNLTLRLTLLKRLKDKLKELESIDHDNYDAIQA